MATPPVASVPPANQGLEGGPPAPPAPPGTEMTGICFRDQLWLSTYPLDRNIVFDYFALSPFYDWTCNNEQLRMRSIHPPDLSHLSKMAGIEYMLYEVMEPHLFVIRKQKRDGPEKVTLMLTYYVLDGSIYQAPRFAMFLLLECKSTKAQVLLSSRASISAFMLVHHSGKDSLWSLAKGHMEQSFFTRSFLRNEHHHLC
ncbi:hypothetical protein F2P56_028010 [Juglans regia]|uniref:Mediator of RNA polymerase II transcription subunit 6 n=2 Tax=Juglans regia TaxID=51240 RepID=A0A2I4GHD0_JUGRE|nr:mediator of RNA polymerase II transcription subunit 6-like isoform X2 [Juglans regia]KAF5453071.1 hypothetical protein F2P56_028010 [Juglans regia]